MRATLLAATFLLTACASSERPFYPSLDNFYSTVFDPLIPEWLPGHDREDLLFCTTIAFNVDVPQHDQEVMLEAINSRNHTAASDGVWRKWFGVTPAEMAKAGIPDNSPAAQRIRHNMQTECPEMAKKYPSYLR